MKTYISTDEFVETYTSGLRAFLEKSFPDVAGETSHIEDLTAWTATYSDAIFQFVSNMPTKPRCKCESTKPEDDNYPT